MFSKFQLSGKVLLFSAFAFTLSTSSVQAALAAKVGATKSQVTAFFGTSNVKVVFTDGASGLYYVDFSQTTPTISQIAKANQTPSVPVISPDGQYCTYATREDNGGGVSSAYICSLTTNSTPFRYAVDTGMSPRFVQNTSGVSVIYSTGTVLNGARIYTNGKTYTQTLTPTSNSYLKGTAVAIVNPGSYYGGISYDNRYVGAGEIGGYNANILDLQSQVRKVASLYHLKVISPQKDTFFYNTSACNVSMSSSRIFTNSFMFFDNGKNISGFPVGYISPVLPGAWSKHQIIYIQRYDSEMLKIFRAPASPGAETTEWQHPEWSNHPYFAAAALMPQRWNDALQDYKYVSEKVMAINLKDSTYLNLVQATDTADAFSSTTLLYPWVWVDTGAGFKEDSTWLKYDYWSKTLPVVNQVGSRIGNKKVVFDNFSLKSSIGIRQVTLFTALGDVMASFVPQKATTVSLDTWRNRYAGVCFVKAECIDGTSAIFRLMTGSK